MANEPIQQQKFTFITCRLIPGRVQAKHPVYEVINNRYNSQLAMIFYYGPWRQYVAGFAPNTVYSGGCLTDISKFLNQLNTSKKS